MTSYLRGGDDRNLRPCRPWAPCAKATCEVDTISYRGETYHGALCVKKRGKSTCVVRSPKYGVLYLYDSNGNGNGQALWNNRFSFQRIMPRGCKFEKSPCTSKSNKDAWKTYARYGSRNVEFMCPQFVPKGYYSYVPPSPSPGSKPNKPTGVVVTFPDP